LIKEGIDRLAAGDRSIAFGVPDLPGKEGLGLDVRRMILNDGFQVPIEIERARLFVPFVILIEILQGSDPEFLPLRGGRLRAVALVSNPLARFLVVHVGHRHPPIGHGATGIEKGHLAEGSLRLEIPKAVKLSDPLIEKGLGFGLRRGHREIDAPHPGQKHGGLTRPFIESLPMRPMPRHRLRR